MDIIRMDDTDSPLSPPTGPIEDGGLSQRDLREVINEKISLKRKIDCISPMNEVPNSSDLRKHTRRTPHNPHAPPFDWQSFQRNLKDRIAYIFVNDLYSDVHFIVGRQTQRIPANKFVLSIGSSVFDAMFSGNWSSEMDNIQVPDVEPAAFNALLRFLYTDDAIITPDTVMATLYAAKKYAVPTLENKCLEFLTKNLRPENAFTLLSQAKLFDEQTLVQTCLEKIDDFAEGAFSSECFTEIDSDLLCEVLERDSLKIREIHLFKAVCKWSLAELTRQGWDQSLENRLLVLEPVLPLIRYPLMSLQDISTKVTPSGLLSDSELVSIYSYLTVNPRPAIKFNCKPRKCSFYSRTSKELVHVKRFTLIKNDCWWDYVDGVEDTICFRTNRNVQLWGFFLYGSKEGPTTYSVSTAIMNSHTDHVLYSDVENYKSNGVQNKFRVMLTHSVKIAAHTTYAIKLNIKGPKSYCGTGGSKVVTVDLKQSGCLKVVFNHIDGINGGSAGTTSVKEGQIPVLVFSV